MKNDFSGKIDGFRALTEEELIATNGGLGPGQQSQDDGGSGGNSGGEEVRGINLRGPAGEQTQHTC
jgi:hypothetical protein